MSLDGKRVDELPIAGNLNLGDSLLVFHTNQSRQTALLTLLRKFLSNLAVGTYRAPRIVVTAEGTIQSMETGVLMGDSLLDFPEIAAGDFEELTMTVVGAAVGSPVTMALPAAFPVGLILAAAWVSATDTVTVRLYNPTGAIIDPAESNFRCFVHKFQ